MINSISTSLNTSVVKPIERTLPSEVRVQQPPEQNEVVEISNFAKDHAQYMAILKKLPDVRPDMVQKVREMMNNKSQHYPPQYIVDGIVALIGVDLDAEVDTTA